MLEVNGLPQQPMQTAARAWLNHTESKRKLRSHLSLAEFIFIKMLMKPRKDEHFTNRDRPP
jgi:hypothetical protein